MKICDLTQSYTDSSGGVRTYIEAKKNFIRKKKSDAHVLIIPGARHRKETNGRFSVYEIKAPLIPGCEPYRFIINLVKVYSILKQERPDVIELGSGYILPWVAFIYRFWHKCAIVSFYHTDYPSAYLKPAASRWLGDRAGILAEKLGYFYVSLVYKRFEMTFTASNQLKAQLEAYHIPRVHYLPLGVETEMFHPARRNIHFRRKLGLSRKDILLLYVGRMDQEKRVHLILEAFQQIPAPHSFHLLCVGDGPLKQALSEASACEPKIKMLPFEKNRKKLAEIFASADMYITAGPHETFGLCVLEAQSSGLPVIGVKAGALPERVPENVGVLGPVDSPSEMALNIIKLSQINYLKLGRNARWLTEQHYAWDQIFAQLFQFYARQSAAHEPQQRILPYLLSFTNPRRKMHLSSRAKKYGNWKEKFTYRA